MTLRYDDPSLVLLCLLTIWTNLLGWNWNPLKRVYEIYVYYPLHGKTKERKKGGLDENGVGMRCKFPINCYTLVLESDLTFLC